MNIYKFFAFGTKFKLKLANIAVFLLFAAVSSLFCVPAKPGDFNVIQPDGTSFQAQQIGDEYFARIETVDGYTVLKDKSGWWNYAVLGADGKLAVSQNKVGKVSPQTAKHLSPDKAVISRSRALRAPGKKVPQMTNTGEVAAVVILIGFTDDIAVKKTTNYFQALLFDNVTGSMRDYYKEVSYGVFGVNGIVAGDKWYNADNMRVYYGADDGTDIDGAGDVAGLVGKAIDAANSDIDFSQYDKDNDGYVDHVIIVHSGHGQESSHDTDDIWSNKGTLAAEKTVDGKKISQYTMIAEDSPVGTFAHVFFHDLGAPDLYGYDGDNTPVGSWCLMANGCWLGTPAGTKPAHPCGYLKYDIDGDSSNGASGWIVKKDITGSESVSIKQLETNSSGSLYRAIIPGTREYFLLENRQKTGYDAGLPEAGIIIWHIDERMPDVTGRMNDGLPNNTYYRAWVEVPGEVPNYSAARTIGEVNEAAYSLEDAETSFTPSSVPNSNSNTGTMSGITINDIGAKSASMAAQAATTDLNVAFSKAKSFPNPFYPRMHRAANIYIPVGDWGRDFVVNIYNMSGILVRRLSDPTEIIPASGQALWDGRNDKGDLVASGLYYYVADTGSKKLRGKITLIK